MSSDGFVTEQLAGAIPTQIGLLAQLTELHLYANQLTSASNQTRLIEVVGNWFYEFMCSFILLVYNCADGRQK